MNETTTALTALFNRIPRRHSADNIKDINGILTEYEDILITIEAVNPFYEKSIPPFFDEASGTLKDSMQAVIDLYADGNRTA